MPIQFLLVPPQGQMDRQCKSAAMWMEREQRLPWHCYASDRLGFYEWSTRIRNTGYFYPIIAEQIKDFRSTQMLLEAHSNMLAICLLWTSVVVSVVGSKLFLINSDLIHLFSLINSNWHRHITLVHPYLEEGGDLSVSSCMVHYGPAALNTT